MTLPGRDRAFGSGAGSIRRQTRPRVTGVSVICKRLVKACEPLRTSPHSPKEETLADEIASLDVMAFQTILLPMTADDSGTKSKRYDNRSPFRSAGQSIDNMDLKHGRTRNSKVVQRRQRLRLHQPPEWRRCFCPLLGDPSGRFQKPAGGQTVQFDVTKGPKGLQAENVQPL